MIINCETFESSLESISNYFNTSRNEIFQTLSDFDMDDYYEKETYHNTGDHLLFKILNEKYPDTNSITEIHWFHLTRVSSSDNFKGAIKPLGNQLDKIWSYLYTLVEEVIKDADWKKFRNNIIKVNHHGYLFGLKASDPFHWGPYAMLVKDVAFKADEMGNHDYLAAPEIVEDICLAFESVFKINLLEKYLQNTNPCIVHFKTMKSDDRVIAPILFYLYCTIHKEKLSIHCNTCFDGKGEEIPESDIINIENLESNNS